MNKQINLFIALGLVALTAGVSGGVVWYYQKQNLEATSAELQTQINQLSERLEAKEEKKEDEQKPEETASWKTADMGKWTVKHPGTHCHASENPEYFVCVETKTDILFVFNTVSCPRTISECIQEQKSEFDPLDSEKSRTLTSGISGKEYRGTVERPFNDPSKNKERSFVAQIGNSKYLLVVDQLHLNKENDSLYEKILSTVKAK